MTRTLILAMLLCGAAQTAGGAPTTPPTAADTLRLEKTWVRISSRAADLSVREVFGYALDAAAVGASPLRVEHALGLAETMQDRDTNSRGFGNFRWYCGAARVEDYNAVEFAMRRAALLRMSYYDRLTPTARQRLDRLVRFSIHGIRRHNVPESYTNIFLMKAWNCLALGEAAGVPELAAEGSIMLDRWLMATWESGLREYASPTYYGVNVECLALIARHIEDPAARAKAEIGLKLLWTDIAANWFAPSLRLAGPHSRDYDYVTGHGYLDNYLSRLGWIPTDEKQSGDAFGSLSLWAPPDKLTRPILSNLPRTVLRRWGSGAGESAVTYIGKAIAVGSAGACYGPVDKVLTVDLGGGPMMPVVNFVMDGRGDPYGKNKQLAGGGHSKAFHLRPFVASAQRGPEVLLLASADTDNAGHFRYVPRPTCMLSHLVLPASGELWIANRQVRLDKGGDAAAVFPGQPVFLRCGKAALAVRVPLALDTAGNPAPMGIFADGGKYDAMRLTITHSPDAPRGRGTVAIWVRAAEGIDDDKDFAAFRRSFSAVGTGTFADGRAEVAAPGEKARLRIVADVRSQKRIAIEGGENCRTDCVLSVDGKDLGRKLLEDVEAIRQYRKLLGGGRADGVEAVEAGQIMEAENAALIVPPFVAAGDDSASGGRFVWAPGPAGGVGASTVARAVWLVNVPAAGPYRISARVQTPTTQDDSFFIRIRQRKADLLARTAWETGVHKQWQWTHLPDETGKAPARLRLGAGPALVEILCRENGARLDAIRLEPIPRSGKR